MDIFILTPPYNYVKTVFGQNIFYFLLHFVLKWSIIVLQSKEKRQ
nr:MAG TPA: hypothetical protein [Caudoviricetes sp.]